VRDHLSTNRSRTTICGNRPNSMGTPNRAGKPHWHHVPLVWSGPTAVALWACTRFLLCCLVVLCCPPVGGPFGSTLGMHSPSLVPFCDTMLYSCGGVMPASTFITHRHVADNIQSCAVPAMFALCTRPPQTHHSRQQRNTTLTMRVTRHCAASATSRCIRPRTAAHALNDSDRHAAVQATSSPCTSMLDLPWVRGPRIHVSEMGMQGQDIGLARHTH